MLALAHVLVAEDLHDRAFLDRYCARLPTLRRLPARRGRRQPKTPDWAAQHHRHAGGRPARARAPAWRRARTLVTVSYSLQRAEHGEQPVWAAHRAGGDARPDRPARRRLRLRLRLDGRRRQRRAQRVPLPTLPQGATRVRDFIPVARIADMLLNPGETFDYNGDRVHLSRHPAGLLGRRQSVPPPPGPQPPARGLGTARDHRRARAVLDRRWRATPTSCCRRPRRWSATTSAPDAHDRCIVAMHRVVEPGRRGARRLRHLRRPRRAPRRRARPSPRAATSAAWLEHLYGRLAQALRAPGIDAPDFDEFWARGLARAAATPTPTACSSPRSAPTRRATRCRTPSGKIEIFSETIAGFGYDDCPGHPVWLESAEWLGAPRAQRFPLHAGRQPAGDAAAQPARHRRLQPGDEGARARSRCACTPTTPRRAASPTATSCACSTTAAPAWPARSLTDDVRPRRGAAGDRRLVRSGRPDARTIALCVHGNPNVLTRDVGTSRLAQGCSGQHAWCRSSASTAALPPVQAFEPPPIELRGMSASTRP